MPAWLLPLLMQAGKFLGVRFLHFAIYATIGLFAFGVYKNFTKDTTTNKTRIENVQTYNACPPEVPKRRGFAGISLWPPRLGVTWEK